MRVRVKICCISSHEEAFLAIRYGADALGLVGSMPSGPGVIDDNLIADIAKTIPPPIGSFLLTCEQSSPGVISHVKKAGTNTVQIVDELVEGDYEHIKSELPHLKIVQAIHVTGEKSIEEARKVSEHVHAILLDSGNPKATVKILGGTGTPRNWQISRELVKAVTVPVFLAGGLNPSNVREAIDVVQPYGIDICSGVRTNGKLDEHKLKDFMHSVKTPSF